MVRMSCVFGHDESYDTHCGGGSNCVHDVCPRYSLIGPNDMVRKLQLGPLEDAAHQGSSYSLLQPNAWTRGIYNR